MPMMRFFKKDVQGGDPTPDSASGKTKVESAAPTEKPSLEKDAADVPSDAVEGGAPAFDETINYLTGMKLAALITSLCLCIFLVALDQTIIAPALGAITAEYKSVKDIVSPIRLSPPPSIP